MTRTKARHHGDETLFRAVNDSTHGRTTQVTFARPAEERIIAVARNPEFDLENDDEFTLMTRARNGRGRFCNDTLRLMIRERRMSDSKKTRPWLRAEEDTPHQVTFAVARAIPDGHESSFLGLLVSLLRALCHCYSLMLDGMHVFIEQFPEH